MAPELRMAEVTKKDQLDQIVRLYWKAFQNPVRAEWWLVHIGPACADHEAALRAEQDQQWAKHVKNPASRWVFVDDETTGEVLGCVEWLFFERSPFPLNCYRMTLDHMVPGDVRDFTEHIVNQISAPRLRWLRRSHVALNLMAVHPHHRNRGIGAMLMEWGMPILDRMGVDSLIESSPHGRWLYEKFGYKFIMAVAMDTERKEPSDTWRMCQRLFGDASFHVMWRPKHGQWDGPQFPWEVTLAGDTLEK